MPTGGSGIGDGYRRRRDLGRRVEDLQQALGGARGALQLADDLAHRPTDVATITA